MAIFAPALARPSAIARPIPLFPPVTIATLPFSDIALLLFQDAGRTRYPRPRAIGRRSMSYRRAPGSDAPRARERAAWIQPDQGVAIRATSRVFVGLSASMAKAKHW